MTSVTSLTGQRAAVVPDLGVLRGAALYVGALLGPGLLLLPGLAVTRAGPASILAWAGLLVASGLFAVVFAALGVRHPSAGGVRAYAEAGLGPRVGRAVAWCFLAGVVTGAPIVCVTCGNYVADLLGGGVGLACVTAAVLLLGTLGVTLRGVRTSATVQFGLVVLLVTIVVGAVAGAAPASSTANWTPFAPHGWAAIGPAASTLMLAFVGWEAIAPLTNRFAEPRRQLPVVIGIAFGVTTVIYLALGAVTVAALGPQASTSVPLAALLTLAVGPAGQTVAAVGAVVLTVGAVLAYLSGAGSLARSLAPGRVVRDTVPAWLVAALLGSGALLIGLLGSGVISLATLVNVPTTFFLVVYLGCTAAACRVLAGPLRAVAAVAFGAVVVVLAFSGYALIPAACVTALALLAARRPGRLRPRPRADASSSQADVSTPQAGASSPDAGAGRSRLVPGQPGCDGDQERYWEHV
ncbi:APC family permease [Plantactinospora sp. BB1]|uniref:APC family permease n=1 Tax=Plantactinospora sp. BB1 TaxID=2071627 RepID=UPI000D163664|nr:APC family permease [Plantactinospora sp. BB1]AVT40923.1 amino acid transporter [Plantactinospora sp. BB1]